MAPHVAAAYLAQLLPCDRVAIPAAAAPCATVGARPLCRSLVAMLLPAQLARGCCNCSSGGAARVNGPAFRAGARRGAVAWGWHEMLLWGQLLLLLHLLCSAAACFPLPLLPWTSVGAILGDLSCQCWLPGAVRAGPPSMPGSGAARRQPASVGGQVRASLAAFTAADSGL